ncbi:MAG: hypothetical protein CMJ65_16615 [Planctomycetaceae bacterium]|jgi:lipoprotein-anchoring transpeptidase ErfK/SrfK|nr:hypothetical protein [Planctomycetaceae bacterium]
MSRRRDQGGGAGLLFLLLLAVAVGGWLGHRGGWWPNPFQPFVTNGLVQRPAPAQSRLSDREAPLDLPEQSEPPVDPGPEGSPALAGISSSFPPAPIFREKQPGSGPIVTADAISTNPGTPEIKPATATRPVVPLPTTLVEIDRLIQDGEIGRAHTALSQVYFQQPVRRPEIQDRIEQTAAAVYFSPRSHVIPAYTIGPGDSLARIAPRFQVGWQYLAAVNQIDPRRIRAGQKLKVIRGPFRVIVGLDDFTLLVGAGSEYVCRFRIGIGKDNSTPLGRFRVLRKIPDPQYTDPDGRVIAGGTAENPLGQFWIDLGEGYGIHGTNEPKSIGRSESRGCVRMHNRDIERLYGMLVTGCEVVIHR